jgi:hypothetical protein
MKKLCFSSYYKILFQAKVSINDETLFKSVVGPLFNSDFDYDSNKGTIGHYKRGTSLATNLAGAAASGNADSLSSIYADGLIKKLSPIKQANIVLAIKDLLSAESSLPDTTVIGDNPHYSKNAIIISSTFSLAALLANVTMYCLKIPNEATPEIDNAYLNTFDSERDKIHFNDNPLRVNTSLSFTARQEAFDKTFFEVSHTGALITPNQSTIKIYALKFQNKEFSFRDINSFILNNVGRYVFSRAKRNEYKVNDNFETLAFDAIKELKKVNPTLSLGDHFSEMMLYSFLECALGAPKVLSKIELNKLSGTFKSSSSGVHLLPSNDLRIRNHQLAFGASKTINDLSSAIDHAFNQIADILANIVDEIELVDANILDSTFERDTTNFLKQTLVPKKDPLPYPDTSFGVFLGYSISLDGTDSLNNKDFIDYLKTRMQADILSVVPYIENKIKDSGLMSHSFYFYVLPLIDAEIDKNTIMNASLEVA